jgi:membrane protein
MDVRTPSQGRGDAPVALASDARRALSWSACRGVLAAALRASITDRMSVAASGCAFWATVALFPAISILILVYGLVFNPSQVEAQLQVIGELLPPPAFALIADRVHQLVLQPTSSLSLGLLVSTLAAFWSAASGTKSVISSLNVVFNVPEQRSFLQFQLIALFMTFCAVLGAVLAIAVLVALPAGIADIGVQKHAAVLFHIASFAVLVGFVGGSIALLYRFGPSRTPPPNQRIAAGSVLATVLWLAASGLLSYYISNISTFGVTYGSLGAVVGVMLWFWVSAYAVLLGAEVNAGLERTPDCAP